MPIHVLLSSLNNLMLTYCIVRITIVCALSIISGCTPQLLIKIKTNCCYFLVDMNVLFGTVNLFWEIMILLCRNSDVRPNMMACTEYISVIKVNEYRMKDMGDLFS